MTVDEFKDRVASVRKTDPEDQIDALCFKWLALALDGNGKEGRVGLQLLEIIKQECMP